MAAKIKFDSSGNPESPTLVLMTRSGKKIGLINYNSLIAHISLQNPSEISFRVNKYYNGVLNNIWADIVDLKLVWCVEYDIIYQISVEIDEEDDTIKIISGVKLSQSELSQIMLYDYQINTEDDIAREDYKAPTVFYNKTNKDVSLLDRMLEKAPHYTIIHVDSTLCNIQRTFSFDNVSLYDALKQVEDEIGCIFTFPKEGGTAKIRRQIAVFDMWSNCIDCGYRGDFTDVCPKCGSKQIISGYGQDTGVFVTSDELADQISIKADVDSVKNCLKLEAGDDLMTATIKNCNPNGSSYIWNITGDMKKDMTEELVQKINDYDTLYNKYNNEKEYYIKVNTLSGYNNVVSKYNAYKNRFSEVSSPIIGFPNIINTKYDVIDLGLFIQTELMPDASLDDTSAEEQVQLLTTEKIGTISVSNIKALSLSSANSAVLGYCKCVIDNRYTTEIIDSSTDDSNHWIGTLKVTNNSDENDTANTSELIIQIDDNYETYVRQKVDKVFAKHNIDNVSIAGIFKLELEEFKSEMKKYSIDMLTDFHDACQAGIDILVEQGVGTKETWAGEKPNLYDDLYIPYYNKLMALEDELKEKENDLSAVKLMERAIDTYISKTHEALDFEKYLGEDLWLEFCCYRRDDKYTNQNYVSDGLNNRELFEKAVEFYECAKKEISQSAELQFSISATLNNLLVIDKFKPLLDDFTIGNWIRVEVDEKIYKLRLLEYEIDYDNLETLNVEFSNVLRSLYGISDQQSIISAVQSMATSYEYTQHQASKGEKSDNVVKDWQQNGLDTTNTQVIGGSDYQNQTWDSHGILLRKYDNIENKYEDNQMRIVNNTIAITNDNWETVKTAIGYYFYTGNNGELKSTYGINAETIVGKLVLGNELYFSNENNTMTFDQNGLIISNGTNTFIVNPEDVNLLKIKNGEEDVFYVDQDGKLHITGDGTYIDVSENEVIEGIKTDILSVQKTSHTHENKSILDKVEQPYTTAERDKLSGLENYVHPAHTAYNKGMYKVAVDDEGHVTEAEAMTKEDIYNAGGVIQSELTFQDYIGDIPLAFMTLFYGGGLRNIAEIGFDRRDDDGKRNFSLKLGGWQDKSTGRLDLVDYIGCQYTITPDPNNSYGTQHYYYVLPAGKSGTIALTSDIPDISGKQDKLTAGTNISISGNTISAKDTTYTSKAAVSGGTDVSLVTTGEKALWNAKTSNIGTITGIKMNGASKGTSGVVDLGTVITAHQDISGKQDKSTAVTHSANTAVGSATKPVYVAANGVATPISHSVNSDVPANAKFTDTTYGDATQSAHGLMTAADKKKLDGMDLSKYLPLAGGVMTGDIDMQTNKRDILVGTHKANTSDGTAVAGGTINTDKTFAGMLPAMRSYIGTYQYKTSSAEAWYALISVRHRNGYSDGSSWGMIIYANLFGGNLQWNLNTNKDVWQGGRTLLDSANFTDYALGKSATASAASKLSTARKINTIAFDGTADIVIPRSTKYMNASSGTGGQTGYVKVATFTVKSQYTNMPTVVRYRNRHTMPVELIFRFKNQSKVDPELEFILQVVELTDYGYKEAYLYKSATSTWDLIIAKSEAWDSVQILDCQQADGVSVAFENTHVSTVPSTAIKATVYERAMVTSTVAAATKLNTARTLTIGNTGKTFDGSANVSWSLDEIGVLGRNTKGMTYKLKNVSYNGSATDYIFNDYSANQAGGGEYITVTGSQNIALGGNCIFLAGWRNTAQGHQCAAMGQENIVAGTANIALGCGNQVTADATGGLSLGNYNTCKANASLSGGWYTEIQKSSNQSIGYGNHVTVATASCAAFGAYNGYSFSGPYLSLGNGTESARANAFRAAAAGVYSSGSYHSSGADYAEYFEWLDGNLNNEDRRGRFVKLDGEKILLAESIDDDILGIVSGNPSVVGDSYEDQWQGQYLTDIYGELLTEDYTDEDGTTRKVWVLNPDYNPDKPYVPRSERREWSAVGMMGKLIVIDDGTCRPNDYCIPTTGGIATRSDGRVGYRVLSRIDDTHIKVLIRG